MEKRTKAKVEFVRMMCDKCGEGEMIRGESILMSNPPQYPHTCNKCGFTTNYYKAYPTYEFVEE